MLDEALTEYIHQGLAAQMGTRNAALQPNGARLAAVRVEADRLHIVAYIPASSAGPLLDDLRSNGQAAVTITRPADDKACQVKGVFVETWAAREDERAFVEGQWEGFLGQLEQVGLPRVASTHWDWWPCVAVRIRATALFDQTPGPAAGAPLA
jgi:hypothetical protein